MRFTMENKNVYYIYHLIDPINNEIFYVGMGKNDRMYYHEKSVNNNKFPNNNRFLFNKIKKIKNNGYKIIYKKLIENLNKYDAIKEEIKQIKNIGRRNLNKGTLCNLTDGGEGMLNPTKEIREKIGYSRVGKTWEEIYGIDGANKRHEELKLRHLNGFCKGENNGMYGKTNRHTEKTREKMRKSHTGKKRAPHTDETRLKISKINKGQIPWNKGKIGVYTIESIKKMSDAKIGKKKEPKNDKK